MIGGLAKSLAVIAALTLVVGLVAVTDHRLKAKRMQRAEVAWWYCANERTGCGADPERLEHRADRIEHGWQERERAYTLAIGALLGAGAMSLLNARRTHAPVPGASRP